MRRRFWPTRREPTCTWASRIVKSCRASGRRYLSILEAGVKVVGFGEGEAPEFLSNTPADASADTDADNRVDFEWISLPSDRFLLLNQWFLVSTAPDPIVFVGWETSPQERFGAGGISGAGKSFEGFVTGDPRVVSALVEHLDKVRTDYMSRERDNDHPVCALPALPQEEWEDDEVPRMMDGDHSSLRLDMPARRILAITDLHGSPQFHALRGWATELAIANASELVLFEMSAASYLVSPYPEEHRKQWQRILSWRDLLPLGRAPLARQLARIQARGVEAGAILPSTHGFKHLAEWAEKEDVDLILLPSFLVRPGLLSRLRGYSLASLLDHTERPVIIVADDGTMCLANDHRFADRLADAGLNHRAVGELVA